MYDFSSICSRVQAPVQLDAVTVRATTNVTDIKTENGLHRGLQEVTNRRFES